MKFARLSEPRSTAREARVKLPVLRDQFGGSVGFRFGLALPGKIVSDRKLPIRPPFTSICMCWIYRACLRGNWAAGCDNPRLRFILLGPFSYCFPKRPYDHATTEQDVQAACETHRSFEGIAVPNRECTKVILVKCLQAASNFASLGSCPPEADVILVTQFERFDPFQPRFRASPPMCWRIHVA